MLSADGLGLGLASPIVAPTPGDGGSAITDDVKEPITPLPNSPLLDLSEEDTFNLASNPDAPFTVFLDFDGHVTADPLWDAALANTRPRFGQPFTTPAFDLDNDSFSFSELELDIIQESFVRVAEDFAPFNINVTTIEPAIEDLENDGSDGDRYGVRVAIGGNADDWFLQPGQGGVGGVALLRTFASAFDTPAYAFIEGGIANPSSQALVVAHEVGHTLGLEHWGNLVFPLPPFDPDFPPVSPDFENGFAGQGFDAPGNVSWGPILGAPFAAEVTQWSNGHYSNSANPPEVRPRPIIDPQSGIVLPGSEAVDENGDPIFFNDFDPTNNDFEFLVSDLGSVVLQDDLAVITSDLNGVTFREDDHVDTLDDPTRAPTLLDANFTSDLATGFGLIETNTDVDFFSFDTDGGLVTIDATPNAFGANLDIRFDVFGPDGQLVGTGAQDFQLEATLTFNAEQPGRYFVAVTGDAYRTTPPIQELAEVGYTDYGSLGRYTLNVNADLGAPPDRFEQNDSFAQAAVPTDDPEILTDTGDFAAADLSIHVTGDEDFFRWEAVGDGQLTVSINFLQSEGDIELFLFDEEGVTTGQPIGQSIGRENGEDITVPVLDGEVFFVRVAGVDGDTQESYELIIDGPGITADEFEQNDTAETAFPIPEEDFFATPNLHVAGDEDFFLYQVATDSEAVFSLLAGASDLTFEVLQGTEVLATGQPNADGSLGLSSTLTVNAGQLLRVRVFSTSGQTVTPYQLIIDGAAAVGDRLEPNDEQSPTPIETDIAVFNNISIHTTQDRDFFSFTAPAFGTLNVDANFQDIFGDLDVRIVDTSTGEQVALGSSITDNESLSIPVVAGVEYLIETFGFRGDLVPVYGLTTEFIAAPPVTGDANGDGLVDRDDYDTWFNQFGQAGENLLADLNGNGSVDTADYAVWRDAFAAAQAAAAQAVQATPITNETSGGHGPGCNCNACTAQASAVAHDHNGDGVADHAGHNHLHGIPAYPGVAVPTLSEPLLPPDRSAAVNVVTIPTPIAAPAPAVSPSAPPEVTQPGGFVEAEPVATFALSGVGLGGPGLGPDPAPAVDAPAATPTSDLALLLLDSVSEDESDDDAFDSLVEEADEDQQAREDAFAVVGGLA